MHTKETRDNPQNGTKKLQMMQPTKGTAPKHKIRSCSSIWQKSKWQTTQSEKWAKEIKDTSPKKASGSDQCSCSICVRLFATPWTVALQASLSITNSQSFIKLMFIESVMPFNHLILYCPLIPLPSIFSSIRVFPNESVLPIWWPKYWSFCFSISPSSEYSGLISFRMGWLDLLAVQGTLKSLFQHHNSKASILQCSPVSMVQFSHPYMTIGKTIALTRWNLSEK